MQEYVDGSNLCSMLEYRNKMPEEAALELLFKLAKALRHMHRLKVFHRDLKLENIIVTDKGEVKLVDFGLCVYNPYDIKFKGKCGSYHSPESATDLYNHLGPSDIYAFGVIAFMVLTGEWPFKNGQVTNPDFDVPREVCEPVRWLITDCL